MAASDSAREYRLAVGIDREGNSLAVRAVGDLDIATAPLLEESIRQAFAQREASSIVVDLTAVGFIDRAGLRVLMWAASRSREDGDRLRINCNSTAVRQLLARTQLDRELPLTA